MDHASKLVQRLLSSAESGTLSAAAVVAVSAVVLALRRVTRAQASISPDSTPRPIYEISLGTLLWLGIASRDALTEYMDRYRGIHEREGVVRFWVGGRWVYVLSDAAHARHVAQNPDIFHKLSINTFVPNTLPAKFVGLNLLSANGEEWRGLRRIMAPPFRRHWSSRGFQEYTEQMMDAWTASCPTEITGAARAHHVEVHGWLQRLTLDVLGRYILGSDFKSLDDNGSDALKSYTCVIEACSLGPYIVAPRLDRWWNPFRYKAWKALDQLKLMFKRIIDEKRAMLTAINTAEVADKEKDLLWMMLEANEAESSVDRLTDEELMDNLTLMFVAGHDTTATALTAQLYLLAKHPEYQERLRNELDSVIMNAGAAPDKGHKLPLLDAVIRESMRMYPPVQQTPVRRVNEDTEVVFTSSSARSVRADGYDDRKIAIPKGSSVVLHVLSMHRNPSIFPDPDVFRPERFMKGENAGEDVVEGSSGFFAFGGGIRICLGMQFSLLEQRVVLSMILRRFRWSLPTCSPHAHEMMYDGTTLMIPRKLELNFVELE